MSNDNDNDDNNEPLDPEQEAKSYRDYIAQEKEKEKETKKKSPFDRVGLLTKLGGNVKNWLERGFALQSDYKLLHYFRSARDFKLYANDPSKNAKRIAGTINLVNARMFLAFYAEFDNCLEISTDEEKRHYYVYAKSRAELQSWVKKLAEAGVTFVCPTTNNDELKMILSSPTATPPVYGMQGFIEKRGKINTAFKKRFFRIEEDKNGFQTLAYYVRYDDTKPKGYIELQDCKVTEEEAKGAVDPRDSKECDFAIETNNRKFILRTTTKKEKQIWIDILRMFIKNIKGPAPFIKLPRAAQADAAASPVAAAPEAHDIGTPIPAHAEKQANGVHKEGQQDGNDSDDSDDAPSSPGAVAAAAAASSAASSSSSADVSSSSASSSASSSSASSASASSSSSAAAAAPASPTSGTAASVSSLAAASGPASPVAAEEKKVSAQANLTAEQAKAVHDKLRQQAENEIKQANGTPAADDAQAKPAASVEQKSDTDAMLMEGAIMMKHGRAGKPHKKHIRLAQNRVYWLDVGASSVLKENKSIDLHHVTKVAPGKTTAPFQRATAKDENEQLCFSLVATDRTLDLVAESTEQRDKWIAALEEVVKRVKQSEAPPAAQ